MGFSSKNTEVGCHFLLQGIFPTQGSNLSLLCLLPWQVGSLPLVPPGKPRDLTLPKDPLPGTPTQGVRFQHTNLGGGGETQTFSAEQATSVNVNLCGFNPWVRKTPGEGNGQRGLAGYSPGGPKESDMTKRVCVCMRTHTHPEQVSFSPDWWSSTPAYIINTQGAFKHASVWAQSQAS